MLTDNKIADIICHRLVTEVQVPPSRRFFHPNPFMEVETSDLPARTSNVHYLTFLMKINPHISETLPGAAQYRSTSLTFLTTWGSDRAVLTWLSYGRKPFHPLMILKHLIRAFQVLKGYKERRCGGHFLLVGALQKCDYLYLKRISKLFGVIISCVNGSFVI